MIARKQHDRRDALERSCGRGIRSLSLGDGVGGGKVEEGLTTWYLGGGNEPFSPMLGFQTSIATAAIPPWHEMVNGPADAKLATLADPEWRARAPRAWDDPLPEQNAFHRDTLDLLILADSENGTGPTGISLAALAAERDQHPSDALADWVLANGIGSRYLKQNSTAVPMTDDDRRAQVVHDVANPYALMGGTDAGAHLTMFCGAGSNLHLITHWARDDGALSLEQAVHCLTQRSADFFGLDDRGVVEPGRRGDLAVFALDELETARPGTALRPARGALPAHPAARRVPRRGGRRRAHRRRRRGHRRAAGPARLVGRGRGVALTVRRPGPHLPRGAHNAGGLNA